MYTAMYCLGAIAAIFSVVFRYEKYSSFCARAIITEIIVVIAAVISGKLLFGVENLMLEGTFSFSGIRIYGLIYSVPLMCFFLRRLVGNTWTSTLSLCTPGLAISSAFARIGCQFAGCCGGPPVWVGNTYVDIPEQLIEGVADLILFFVLLLLEKRGKRVWLYPIYLLSYAVLRFSLDFLRDSPIVFMNLTIAQLISVMSIIIAFVWILILTNERRRGRKNEI